MPEMQIVINVHGGLVQEVFASEPLSELVVVDWDVAPGDHQAVEVETGGRHLRASVTYRPVSGIRSSSRSGTWPAATSRP